MLRNQLFVLVFSVCDLGKIQREELSVMGKMEKVEKNIDIFLHFVLLLLSANTRIRYNIQFFSLHALRHLWPPCFEISLER